MTATRKISLYLRLIRAESMVFSTNTLCTKKG
jgi:hypothetical protein